MHQYLWTCLHVSKKYISVKFPNFTCTRHPTIKCLSASFSGAPGSTSTATPGGRAPFSLPPPPPVWHAFTPQHYTRPELYWPVGAGAVPDDGLMKQNRSNAGTGNWYAVSVVLRSYEVLQFLWCYVHTRYCCFCGVTFVWGIAVPVVLRSYEVLQFLWCTFVRGIAVSVVLRSYEVLQFLWCYVRMILGSLWAVAVPHVPSSFPVPTASSSNRICTVSGPSLGCLSIDCKRGKSELLLEATYQTNNQTPCLLLGRSNRQHDERWLHKAELRRCESKGRRLGMIGVTVVQRCTHGGRRGPPWDQKNTIFGLSSVKLSTWFASW